MKQSCFAISLIVGTGVFGISGLAVEVGGRSGSLYGWMLAAVAVIPFLVVFYSLGKDRIASPKQFEFLALATYVLVVPTIAYVGSRYLQQSMNWSPEVLPFVCIALLSTAMGVNLVGDKWMNALAKTACLALVVILTLTVLFGLRASSVPSLANVETSSVWRTASLVFFAFIGWENLSSEKRPARVYLISFGFVVVLYLGLAFVFSSSEAKGITGLLDLFRSMPGGSLFIVGALLVIVANITSWMQGATKKLGGRDGLYRLQVVYMLVASLLISNLVKVDTLFQLVNKNFLVMYFLTIVLYVRAKQTPLRLAVGFSGLSSLLLLAGEPSYAFLFPCALLAIGMCKIPNPTCVLAD